MRLAFIIKSLGGGGAERVCVTLANRLSEMGQSVEILSISKGEFNESALDSRVIFHCAHARKTLFALPYIYKTMRTERYDVVLCFGYELAVAFALLRSAFFIPCVIAFRNVNSISREIFASNTLYRRVVVQPLIKRYVSDVDLVINQCVGMKEDFIAFTGCASTKNIVIYNPVLLPHYASLRSPSRPEQSGERYFLYVGRLEKQKRLEDMFRAFMGFTSKVISGYRLKIFGAGSRERELRCLAKQLGVAGSIDFMGYREDLTSVYAGAIATLLTSEYEGFPNVLLESIAAGTPIVAYDCPSGPGEIVEDGVNGFLVQDGNVNAFSEAMLKAVRHHWCARDIAASALRYDSQAIASQYLEALGALVERGGR